MPAPYQYYQNPQGHFFRTRTKIANLPKGAKYFGEHRAGKAAWNAAQSQESNNAALQQKPGEGGWLQQKLQGLKNFAAGEPSKELRFDLLTPQQKELFSDYYLPYIRNQIEASQGKSLEDFSQGFDPFEKQIRQNYAQNTLPSIAERFSGLGAQGSSGFANLLRQGQQDLETQIGAQRAQFGLQNRQNQWQNTLGALGYGTQNQFENAYIPRQPGFFENILTAGAGGVGKALGGKWFGSL